MKQALGRTGGSKQTSTLKSSNCLALKGRLLRSLGQSPRKEYTNPSKVRGAKRPGRYDRKGKTKPQTAKLESMKVGVIMGSKSDWPTMFAAVEMLDQFGIESETEVVSAHRTPERMYEYAKTARDRGISVIIAGAGGAAHLPGMVASLTTLPVIGVPVQTKTLSGVDSLYSIVQMPGGIPVATVAIGNAKNAGLLAIQILGVSNKDIAQKLHDYRESLKDDVAKMNQDLEGEK